MKTEEELISETKKWLLKAKEKRNKISVSEKSGSYLKNIDAYISDAAHFMGKKDHVRAFESVIWAWAWMEILGQLEIIKTDK